MHHHEAERHILEGVDQADGDDADEQQVQGEHADEYPRRNRTVLLIAFAIMNAIIGLNSCDIVATPICAPTVLE